MVLVTILYTMSVIFIQIQYQCLIQTGSINIIFKSSSRMAFVLLEAIHIYILLMVMQSPDILHLQQLQLLHKTLYLVHIRICSMIQEQIEL